MVIQPSQISEYSRENGKADLSLSESLSEKLIDIFYILADFTKWLYSLNVFLFSCFLFGATKKREEIKPQA